MKRFDESVTITIDEDFNKMAEIRQWAIDNDIECEIYDYPIFTFWFATQEDAMACKLRWT